MGGYVAERGLAADGPDVGAAVGRRRVRRVGPGVPAGDLERLLLGAGQVDGAADGDDADEDAVAAAEQAQRLGEPAERERGARSDEQVLLQQVGVLLLDREALLHEE